MQQREEHISALSLLNLSSNRLESVLGGREIISGIQLMAFAERTWLNTTCMTAGMFYLQERFGNVGIVNPAFTSMTNTDKDPRRRRSIAASFGAFDRHRNYRYIAGALHLPGHWTSFLFTPTATPDDPTQEMSAGICILYDCDGCHYLSMEKLCRELLSEEFPGEITFVRSPKLALSDASSCGVLSLLFLELELGGMIFNGDALGTSIPYLRLRYLRLVMKMLQGVC